MAADKRWKLLSSKPIYESKWLSLYDNSYELPNGKVGENYLHIKRRDYVLIIAITQSNELIIEKQYRRGVDDFVYELPAGWVDEGEDALTSALRELEEETGLTGEAQLVNVIYPQPGFMNTKAFIVFVKLTSQEETEKRLAVDEDIEVIRMPLTEVRSEIVKGKIRDMGFLSAFSVCDHLLPR